jgi:hypothetical protein
MRPVGQDQNKLEFDNQIQQNQRRSGRSCCKKQAQFKALNLKISHKLSKFRHEGEDIESDFQYPEWMLSPGTRNANAFLLELTLLR